jgi:hypothetical protein
MAQLRLMPFSINKTNNNLTETQLKIVNECVQEQEEQINKIMLMLTNALFTSVLVSAFITTVASFRFECRMYCRQ